ncbi:hypothetical protein LCGC14_0878950 [marine sediment metagenome]|uniref:Disease resistance R13L4/SHOC-2-like LRR domain-containing protein n=1 Tax=marine sediment metagenome TaxID=412755 RepID=A0A0F9PN48_9ZZZZ
MQEFKVNHLITLKLEGKDTVIYVAGKRFQQCKYLLINIPEDSLDSTKEIHSIDEAANIFDGYPGTPKNIPPETRFWAHCSNLETWAENNYDTRLLHSNLAFPLLKKLTESEDKQALSAFKEEIAKRIESGYFPTIQFLWNEGFFKYLTKEELTSILPSNGKEFKALVDIEQLLNRKILLNKNFNESMDDQLWFLMKDNKITDLEITGNYDRKIDGFIDLNYIPQAITNFKDLKSLKMVENMIKTIPKPIGRLNKLEHLDFQFNQIKTVHGSIGKCKKLRSLNLSCNCIKIIPDTITKLNKLKSLDLSRNFIKKIPDSIEKLENLKTLDISHNKLKNLPDSIKNLKSLTYISIAYNKFGEFPKVLLDIESLVEITIEYNNLTYDYDDINSINYKYGRKKKEVITKKKKKIINTLDLKGKFP